MFKFGLKDNKNDGVLNIFLIEDNEGNKYIRSNINNGVYTYNVINCNNDKNIFITELHKLIIHNDPDMRLSRLNIKTNKPESLESLNNLSNLFDKYTIDKNLLTQIEQQDAVFYLQNLMKNKTNIPMTPNINIVKEVRKRTGDSFSPKNYLSEEDKKNKVRIREEYPNNTIVIYTDASMKNERKLREKNKGYGIIIGFSDGEKISTIYKIKARLNIEQINNVDEIEAFAIKRAIKFIKKRRDKGEISKDYPIEIRSDSLGNIIYLNELSDIKNNKSYELKNIINEIKESTKDFNISYSWVKGHSKNYHNNMADKLARQSLSHKNNSFIVAHKNEDNLIKLRKKY